MCRGPRTPLAGGTRCGCRCGGRCGRTSKEGKICSMYKLHRVHDALMLLAVPSSQEWPPLPSLTSRRILSFLFNPPSAAGRFCLWGGRSLGPFWGFRALACRGEAASDWRSHGGLSCDLSRTAARCWRNCVTSRTSSSASSGHQGAACVAARAAACLHSVSAASLSSLRQSWAAPNSEQNASSLTWDLTQVRVAWCRRSPACTHGHVGVCERCCLSVPVTKTNSPS